MKKIYVAGSIHNTDNIIAIQERLTLSGRFQLTFDWAKEWQSTRNDPDRLFEARRKDLAVWEIEAVKRADVLLLVLPTGRGAHIEYGVAVGLDIPRVIINPDHKEDIMFYGLPNTAVLRNEDEAIHLLLTWARL